MYLLKITETATPKHPDYPHVKVWLQGKKNLFCISDTGDTQYHRIFTIDEVKMYININHGEDAYKVKSAQALKAVNADAETSSAKEYWTTTAEWVEI